MLGIWLDADEVVCVSLGYVEVRATIARRFRPRVAARVRWLLDDRWQQVQTIPVDDLLVDLAAHIAESHRLRALDAVHLAAATEVKTDDLVFATWDKELAQAARASGFAVVP